MASPRESTGVVVVCEHALIREVLVAALHERGIAAIEMPASVGGKQLDEVRRWTGEVQPTYGLLVTELDDVAQLFAAIRLLDALPVTWLVLTSLRPGPAWGALFDAGAAEVLPETTSLDEFSARIRRLDLDDWAIPHRERAELILAWRRISEEQRALRRRLSRLSTREMQVLMELQEGHSVRIIAARAGVAEGTVRAQVKSLFKKLGVNSQLQAVACFRQATGWLRAE